MLKRGLSKAKITALAVALCMISMSVKEEGILASASSGVRYTWPVPARKVKVYVTNGAIMVTCEGFLRNIRSAIFTI